jgi:hypothetical protein
MTLDFLDAAFVDRWQAATPHVGVAEPVTTEPVEAETVTDEIAAPTADDFVGRLLVAAPAAWATLADEAVAARSRGRRTIAIVACERSAGCSTLAAGIVRVLQQRGRDAVVCAAAAVPLAGPTHDKRIVIVDGGVWFPPGRIHRQRLLLTSSGCDAAILVVRSGGRAPPGWSACLEAIGVEPLGEVVSFVPPTVEVPA